MNMVRNVCALPVLLCILTAPIAYAQVSGAPPSEGDKWPPRQTESAVSGEVSDSALPEIAVDHGFDRIVKLVDLPDVINARDARLLTDLALLTKAAEDTLRREHTSGVTSQALLELANALAAQEGDTETLARLKAVGITRSAKAFHADVKAFEIPATTSPETVDLFQGLSDEIKTAVLLNDIPRLERVKAVVDSRGELSPSMKSYLGRMLTDASGQQPPESSVTAVQRLLAATRAAASMIYYEHSWGGGATYTIYGEFQRSNMPSGWNDVVSSVWVRRGYLLYSYEHVNYKGARCWVLVDDNGIPGSSPTRQKTQELAGYLFEMSSHGWNDVISSFRVTDW